MAEALASVLVELLATAAIEKVNEHVRLAVDARDEVKKLENTFKTLQKVLNDAEQRQLSDESVKNWVDQFKDVAYDMEDVLDEWRTEILRSQIEGAPDENDGKYKQMIKEKVSSYLCSPFSCFSKAALYYDIGSRIKEIRDKLDSIQKDKDQFEFIISKTNASQGFDYSERPRTSSIILDPIFGRDWDKAILLNRLVGETSSNGSSSSHEIEEEKEPYGPHNIISIIGMGGLGKTTLAQLLINDNKVAAHFENTVWVCVSEPFDRTRIAQAIIHEATKIPTSTSEWNRLHHELIDSVKGKRFLLVLDDVWTEDEKDLNPLKDLLRHGASGSRIMLTTRNKSVSEIINSYQHSLGILSHDNCWSLISRKANFVGSKNKENKALKDIGFEIARKCQGLPLYASMLGSLLRKKKTEIEWRQVLGSKTWELEDAKQKLFKPLLLSYDDLQPPLKRCFAYCAIFPKDHRIKKHSLISMWMAQGFLNSPRGQNLDPRSIGEKYFVDLAERSFFQDFTQDDINNGSINHCKMHDIVLDFAQFLTKDEFCVKHIPDEPSLNDISKAHHLTLLFGYNEENEYSIDASLSEAKHLRSLRLSTSVCIHNSSGAHSLSNSLCHLKCLRVLQFKRYGITRIPAEIKELIHLRYLDLSWSFWIEELPDSVCSLYNLETLKLKGCQGLYKLPRGMGRMINLIHLDIRKTRVELSLPGGTGKWSNYSTACLTVIGLCDQGSSMKEFKDLAFLQGCINIPGLGRLKTAKEASKIITFKKKQELCHNKIFDGIMTISHSEEDKQNMDAAALVVEVTEGLFGVLIQPDPSLMELQISNYLGLEFTNWITKGLTHLSVLDLSRIDNCAELPALGLLPSLEKLSLKCLNNLRRIGVEIYGICVGGGGVGSVNLIAFPKLKSLTMSSMEDLEEFDLGVNQGDHQQAIIMPCLNEIYINDCRKLKTVRSLSNLQSLEVLDLTCLDNLEEFIITPVPAQAEGGHGEEHHIITTNVLSVLSLCIRDCPKLMKSEVQLLKLPKLNKLVISNRSMLSDQLLTTSPNLTSLCLCFASHALPPKGLARFEKLQHLSFSNCPFSTCIPEDIQHLMGLQTFEIDYCEWPPEITDKDCREQDEEACSSIMSHIPKIVIKRKRKGEKWAKYELSCTLTPDGTRQHSYLICG